MAAPDASNKSSLSTSAALNGTICASPSNPSCSGGEPLVRLVCFGPGYGEGGPVRMFLVYRDEQGETRSFRLEGKPVTIGRETVRDFVLEDRQVSRHHASIEVVSSSY